MLSALSATFAALPRTPPWMEFSLVRLESQMALGISLLRVEHAPLGSSIKQLSSIPGLVEAFAVPFAVPGQFDIVALWQGKNSEEIMKTSIDKLTTVGGLSHSETLLAYAPYFKA